VFTFPEDGNRAGFRNVVIYLKNTMDKCKTKEKKKENVTEKQGKRPKLMC